MSSNTSHLLANRVNALAEKHLYVKKFHEVLFGVVRSLTSAIDSRDPYTLGHSERVARIAVQLGRELGLSSREKSTLYLASLLHDIGKIAIDDRVLKKPAALTSDEYRHVMTHVEIGVSLVQEIHALRHLLPAIKHHHERYNGGGYPSGIAGDQIPLAARILAVADGIDAMLHDRPHRPRRTESEVQRILRDEFDRQWDGRIVAAALGNWPELITIQEHGASTSLRFAIEHLIPASSATQIGDSVGPT